MTDPAAIPSSAEKSRFALAFAALLLGASAMAVSPVLVRLADVGPYASAFWRAFLALPFLAIWAWREAPQTPFRLADFDRNVWLAGLLFAGDLFFWHLSILSTTVANATFLATTSPVWVTLGAWLLLREKISKALLLGLLLCLLGGGALVGQSYGFAPERLMGDFYGAVTAIFFGGYVLALRNARARLGPGRLAFLSTAITAACLFVIAIAREPTLLPHSLSGAAALLALAVISQALGQGLLAVALGVLPATFSSLVIFLEAVQAAALGWIIFGEALGLLQWLGGVLILLGIWIARPRRGGVIP